MGPRVTCAKNLTSFFQTRAFKALFLPNIVIKTISELSVELSPTFLHSGRCVHYEVYQICQILSFVLEHVKISRNYLMTKHFQSVSEKDDGCFQFVSQLAHVCVVSDRGQWRPHRLSSRSRPWLLTTDSDRKLSTGSEIAFVFCLLRFRYKYFQFNPNVSFLSFFLSLCKLFVWMTLKL